MELFELKSPSKNNTIMLCTSNALHMVNPHLAGKLNDCPKCDKIDLSYMYTLVYRMQNCAKIFSQT